MATIQNIRQRAQQLAEKWQKLSISPEEVGLLIDDLAALVNDAVINGSSLGIRRTYDSLSAMQADGTAPNDQWGEPLKRGQLVAIASSDADAGKIYLFADPNWAYVTTVDARYVTTDALAEEITKIENSISEVAGKTIYNTYIDITTIKNGSAISVEQQEEIDRIFAATVPVYLQNVGFYEKTTDGLWTKTLVLRKESATYVADVTSTIWSIAVVKTDKELNGESYNPIANAPVQQAITSLSSKVDTQLPAIEEAKNEAIESINQNEQSAISNFNAQRVTPEMLSESTKQLIEASGGGTITNLPDDEDLESVDDGTGSKVMKFRNKAYSAENFSGLGRVYLRKNMVEGKNVLTQEMISEPNTIYHIQYDYDMDGSEITIPENSMFIFDGGKIYNGIIVGNKMNTTNRYTISSFLSGKETSHEIPLQNALNICRNIDIDVDIVLTANIQASERKYAVKVPSNTNINISSTIKLGEKTGRSMLFYIDKDAENVIIEGNGELIGETGVRPGDEQRCTAINIRGGKNVKVRDLYIHDFWEDAVNVASYDYTSATCSDKIDIQNLRMKSLGRNGISITGATNVNIVNNIIEDCIGLDPASAIDIERQTEEDVIENIYINGLIIKRCIRGVVCAGNTADNVILDNIITEGDDTYNAHSQLYSANNLKIRNSNFITLSLSNVTASNIETKELYVKSNYSIDGDRPATPTHIFTNCQFNCVMIDASSISYISFTRTTIQNEENKKGIMDNSGLADIEYKHCIVAHKKCSGRVYGGYRNSFFNTYIYEDRSAPQDSSSDCFYFISCNIVCDNESKGNFFISRKESFVINSTIEIKTTLSSCSPCSSQNGGKWYWYQTTIINPPATYRISSNNVYEYNTNILRIGDREGVYMYVSNGNTSTRDIMQHNIVGQEFYNTTIKKKQWWDGKKWTDSNGIPSDVSNYGIYNNKPLSSTGIPIGFTYFCTDRQTTEGTTNGIMIYHKGSDVWVDALGRVVS